MENYQATLRVPVHQCDKAFKNKHGEYFESGVATLGFDADKASYDGLEVDMFDASQRDLAESTIGRVSRARSSVKVPEAPNPM